MKNILVSVSISTLLSCHQEAKPEKTDLFEKMILASPTDNLDILGNWEMCSYFGNDTMTQFNICPTISFLSTGSGIIGNALTQTELFTWRFEKGKLNLITKRNTSGTTFPDTLYFAKNNNRK